MTECIAGPTGECGGAVGLRSVRDDVIAGPRCDSHDHPRKLHSHTAAAEAARPDPGRIEHPEVQPRRRGDHDLGHARSAT